MSGTLRNREYSMRNHGLKSAEEERGLNKSFYQDKSHYLGIQPGPVQVLGHRDLLTTKSRTLAFLIKITVEVKPLHKVILIIRSSKIKVKVMEKIFSNDCFLFYWINCSVYIYNPG